MRRDLGDGYELDDDRARLDLLEVCRFLVEESYWARDRELTVQQDLVREAARVVGLYHDGAQAGFCRAARLSPGLFYLADVYVLPADRGRGLGVELVREMVERPPLGGAKWLLHTDDAHELYRKFGFAEPASLLMERPRPAAA